MYVTEIDSYIFCSVTATQWAKNRLNSELWVLVLRQCNVNAILGQVFEGSGVSHPHVEIFP